MQEIQLRFSFDLELNIHQQIRVCLVNIIFYKFKNQHPPYIDK